MKAENISSTTSQVVSQENEQNESKSDGKRKFKTDLKDFYHPHLKFVSLHTGFQHVVVWVELLEEINKKKTTYLLRVSGRSEYCSAHRIIGK